MRDQCWLVEEFEGHWRRRCFAWVPAGVGMTKCGVGMMQWVAGFAGRVAV